MTLSKEPQYPSGLNWLYNLLLITPELPRIVGVSWTLNLEMLYYSMFALTFIFPPWAGKLVIGGWLLGLLVINLTIGAVPGLYNAHSLLFIAGCALSYGLPYICRTSIPAFGLVIIGLFGLLAALTIEHISHSFEIKQIWEKIGFSIGFLLLMGSMLVWETRYGAGILKHRTFILLGQSSYVLYLFHMIVGAVLFKIILITSVGDVINHSVLITGLIISACIASFIINKKIEAPLNKIIKKKIG
jgi:peptidoglycan/LPS O-acetylase OafA/YrhL